MPKYIQSYRLLSKVGAGGMGVVYKAEHKFRGEIVALKSLNLTLTADERSKQRFRNEAKVLSLLDHPNVVKILDFIEDGEGIHIVTEFVDGLDLSELLYKIKKPLPLTFVIYLLEKLLPGIDYLHSKDIVHRDIKPGNILLNSKGDVKITDFSIARIDGDQKLTKTGNKVGTLLYMSPEQVLGKTPDEKSDVYSLGICLYELLTGKLPYHWDKDLSEFKIMQKIVNEKLPSLKELNADIPDELIKIVEKATHKEPGQRFSSTLEFRNEILKFKKHLNVSREIEEIKATLNFIRQISEEKSRSLLYRVKTTHSDVVEQKTVNEENKKVDSPINKKVIISSISLILFIATLIVVYKFVVLRPFVEMIKVEGGVFDMGCYPAKDANCENDEFPVLPVEIKSFYLSKYEVSQFEFEDVMGYNPSYHKSTDPKSAPVENLTWVQAAEFCNALSEREGLSKVYTIVNDVVKRDSFANGYRLPTEAEWEFAAKGGNNYRTNIYSGSDDMNEVGAYLSNSGGVTNGSGKYSSNELGFYDMSGNVYEFCENYYRLYGFTNAAGVTGSKSEFAKVRRGGSFASDPAYCRVSYRSTIFINQQDKFTGFRVARSLVSKTN